jgi:hypothetical protein
LPADSTTHVHLPSAEVHVDHDVTVDMDVIDREVREAIVAILGRHIGIVSEPITIEAK